jgi:uncharacterized lipoprotein
MKRIALAAIILATLAACSTTPYYDRHFGEAAREAMSRQVIHPEPTSSPQTTEGQISNSVIDRYHKAYAIPPEPVNVYNIGVGAN